MESIISDKTNNQTKSAIWPGGVRIKRNLTEERIKFGFKQFFFQILTLPNNGEYEFTINSEFKINKNKKLDLNENITLNEYTISRVNKYGSQANCIIDTFPDLRKYCSCKF